MCLAIHKTSVLHSGPKRWPQREKTTLFIWLQLCTELNPAGRLCFTKQQALGAGAAFATRIGEIQLQRVVWLVPAMPCPPRSGSSSVERDTCCKPPALSPATYELGQGISPDLSNNPCLSHQWAMKLQPGFQPPPPPCTKSSQTRCKPAFRRMAHLPCWQEQRGARIRSPHPYPTSRCRPASLRTEKGCEISWREAKGFTRCRPGSSALLSGFNKVAISNASFCPQNSSSSSMRFIRGAINHFMLQLAKKARHFYCFWLIDL